MAPRNCPTSPPIEKMAGEYEVMGIYLQGHLMEFIRPILGRGVQPTKAVCGLEEGASALVVGWPIARQHPKGREVTVFVTIEDEEGDVQPILMVPGLPAPPPGFAEQHHPRPRQGSPTATAPPPW